jgi:branched-chain amino acid transport system ATP-binding protein
MSRPRLLLLDEPSLGLAPIVAARIMGLLRDLRDRMGLTVLLVEQNARAALSIADRGIVLSLGRVVADDEPSALARDTALRHAYLGF